MDDNTELIYAADYDLAVDVRSPGEFEEDHVIGAINCPVLDNEERAIVGTIYKQVRTLVVKTLCSLFRTSGHTSKVGSVFRARNSRAMPELNVWSFWTGRLLRSGWEEDCQGDCYGGESCSIW